MAPFEAYSLLSPSKLASSKPKFAYRGEDPSVLHSVQRPLPSDSAFRVSVAIGSGLWTGDWNGSISIRDPNTMEVVRRVYQPSERSFCLCILPLADRHGVWCGFSSGTIRVFTMEAEDQPLNELRKHSGAVYALAPCNPHRPSHIFSGSADFQIYQWDVRTYAFVRQFNGHTNNVRALLAEGSLLYSGGDDGIVRIWDTVHGWGASPPTMLQLECTLQAVTPSRGSSPERHSDTLHLVHSGSPITVLARVAEALLCGREDGSLDAYDLSTSRVVARIGSAFKTPPHSTRIIAIVPLPRSFTSQRFLAASADGVVTCWGVLDAIHVHGGRSKGPEAPHGRYSLLCRERLTAATLSSLALCTTQAVCGLVASTGRGSSMDKGAAPHATATIQFQVSDAAVFMGTLKDSHDWRHLCVLQERRIAALTEILEGERGRVTDMMSLMATTRTEQAHATPRQGPVPALTPAPTNAVDEDIVAELTSRINALKAKNKELVAEHKRMRELGTRARESQLEEVETLHTRIRVLEQHLSAERSNTNRDKHSTFSLQSKLDTVESENIRLRKELEAASTSLEELSAQATEAERDKHGQIELLHEELKQAASHADALKKENELLQEGRVRLLEQQKQLMDVVLSPQSAGPSAVKPNAPPSPPPGVSVSNTDVHAMDERARIEIERLRTELESARKQHASACDVIAGMVTEFNSYRKQESQLQEILGVRSSMTAWIWEAYASLKTVATNIGALSVLEWIDPVAPHANQDKGPETIAAAEHSLCTTVSALHSVIANYFTDVEKLHFGASLRDFAPNSRPASLFNTEHPSRGLTPERTASRQPPARAATISSVVASSIRSCEAGFYGFGPTDSPQRLAQRQCSAARRYPTASR